MEMCWSIKTDNFRGNDFKDINFSLRDDNSMNCSSVLLVGERGIPLMVSKFLQEKLFFFQFWKFCVERN